MARTKTSSRPRRPDPTALGRAFKRRLKSGDLLLGGMVTEFLRPSLVKIYRHADFDFIYVEKEHTFFEGSEMTEVKVGMKVRLEAGKNDDGEPSYRFVPE